MASPEPVDHDTPARLGPGTQSVPRRSRRRSLVQHPSHAAGENPSPAPPHAAYENPSQDRDADIAAITALVSEMDTTLSMPFFQNSVLHESWGNLKAVLPEDVSDWFAQLWRLSDIFSKDQETLTSNRDRLYDQNQNLTNEARVLEITQQEIRQYKEHETLCLFGCLVIRGDYEYPDEVASEIVQSLRLVHAEATVQIQNFAKLEVGKKGKKEIRHTIMIGMDQLLETIDARGQSPDAQQMKSNRMPVNLLDMGPQVAIHSEPKALIPLEYRLLTRLVEKTNESNQRKLGNPQTAAKGAATPKIIDLEACLRFCLYGQRGSLSMWHADVLNGTHTTCLSGAKLWFLYQGPMNDENMNDFRAKGTLWRPPPGSVKLIYLKPGDTLIMRPGYRVIHAVLTLQDSFMVGGMMWSLSQIGCIMKNLRSFVESPYTSNELLPRQLPEILDTLNSLVDCGSLKVPPGSKESIEDLVSAMQDSFSCQSKCKGVCTDCPCMKTSLHGLGCTSWCHPHSSALDSQLRHCAMLPGSKTKSCNCDKTCNTQCPCVKVEEPCGKNCHSGKPCLPRGPGDASGKSIKASASSTKASTTSTKPSIKSAKASRKSNKALAEPERASPDSNHMQCVPHGPDNVSGKSNKASASSTKASITSIKPSIKSAKASRKSTKALAKPGKASPESDHDTIHVPIPPRKSDLEGVSPESVHDTIHVPILPRKSDLERASPESDHDTIHVPIPAPQSELKRAPSDSGKMPTNTPRGKRRRR